MWVMHVRDRTALTWQGKYLEIMFNGLGQPIGAQITNYLLEKVRRYRTPV